MSRSMIRIALAISAFLLLAIGIAGGRWWAKRAAADDAAMSNASSASPQQRKPLYWYDPMLPDQHFDKPGLSSMGMTMVPRYANDVVGGGVRIDSGVQQNVGIRTGVVEIGNLDTRIRVPATLTWDLRQESVVSARVDGLISRLNVKAPYESVHRGQPLATILAPMWGSAIAESNALAHATSASARSLQSAARERLHMLGLSANSTGADGSVVLRSPRDGVVSELMVREGQTAMAGMPLFRINGTQTLWLEAAIPQASAGGIGPGTKIEASVSSVPDRIFEGQVETLLPQIDASSRTQRARIVLRNQDGVLVPGMFAELTVRSGRGAAVPLVPSEALIATGSDSRVIVMNNNGSFQPVRVQTGRSSGGRIEILSGLKGGEHVVTSGQFLIDSEASLAGAMERLDKTLPSPPPQTTSRKADRP